MDNKVSFKNISMHEKFDWLMDMDMGMHGLCIYA